MKILFLSRLLAPLVAPTVAFVKKAWVKRTAAAGETATYSPIADIDKETLVHLGAEEASGWKTIFDLLARWIVQSNSSSLPHVRNWLNLSDTQARLQRLSHARISAAPMPIDDHEALVSSYMLESGEHRHLAEDIIDLTVKVFVAGVYGGVKDEALSAQLQISVAALQQRFDQLHHQLNAQDLPEPGWSLAAACKENSEWLSSTFSSRAKAKISLGQKLSPADPNDATNAVFREKLVQKVAALLVDLPPGGVLALTGDEGNGKSWLVAQAWLSWTVKPLTIFLTAEDVNADYLDPIKLLSVKLSEQTNRQGSERHQAFWAANLITWRAEGKSPTHGIVIIVDGLNQRPRTEWARTIDILSGEMQRIGAKVIITSRKRYFDSSVRPGLISPCRELPIPEWTPEERDKLLADRGIHSSSLNKQVILSLCNPRLLSVALTLLDTAQLKAMTELSIPRLLFEHLRSIQGDSYGKPVDYFTRALQERAKQVLHRLSAKQVDDLNVFDGGIDAVAEGRFFIPLTEDATRYTLQKDGLNLAMGLAILAELHKALRNGRDLNEALALITEPIAALDQTSNAIFAALTVACINDTFSIEVSTAIVISFAGLQNLDERSFDAVAALARNRPQAFLNAAETLALDGATAPNYDWVKLALHQAKNDDAARKIISDSVKHWLSYFTADIEQHVMSFGMNTDEIAESRENLKGKLISKIADLSSAEQEIFSSLTKKDVVDLSPLGRLAVGLLPGIPLAYFAPAFVQWSLSNSLNGNHQAPTKELRQLIRFNGNDWELTRTALLQSAQKLITDKFSPVGQRALINLLQSTGHPDDAQRAQEFIDLIKKDWPANRSNKKHERYCAGEPWDPSLTEPHNAKHTATEYAAIDVATLSLQFTTDLNDQIFDDARPCVTRFYPDIAINKHREFIDHVLCRTGPPLRQGINLLLTHASLIKDDQARTFAHDTFSRTGETTKLQSLGDEAQVWGLFQLEIAFPLLDPTLQLEALLKTRYGSNISYQLIEMIKPLADPEFENRLKRAFLEDNGEEIFTILLFNPYINLPVSESVLAIVPTLLTHKSSFVRAYTWQMIARSGDQKAVKVALDVQRDIIPGFEWEQRLERWHRSELMLVAAEQNLIYWEELASAIDYGHLGRFSSICKEAIPYCARVIDILIQRLLGLSIDLGHLEIDVEQSTVGSSRPQSFALREERLSLAKSDEVLKRALENPDEFEERQKNLHIAFDSILSALDGADARDLLDQFSIGDFEAMVNKAPDFATKWCKLLLDQPIESDLAAVRNIALLLARDIAPNDSATSVSLFEKYEPVKSLVRVTFGKAAIELSSMVLWSANGDHRMDELRFRRLDLAANNDDLAKEVWAALWNNKSEQLKRYIDRCVASLWPAMQARGILVAGLMGENEASEEILKQFKGIPGLLGETQNFAYDIYKRHLWAMHWYTSMQVASTAEDFWTASVLFLEVVDGRIEAVRNIGGITNQPFLRYGDGIRRRFENIFSKRSERWKKQLFVEDAPPKYFLTQRSVQSEEQRLET